VRQGAYGARRAARKATLGIVATLALAGAAAAEEVVIAALGDSLTQGYGLPPEEGFVPTLERWLQARGHDVRLINAGVSGDTTAGGLSRVDWTLTDEVDGLIVALGGNDMLRGIAPEVARENLDGILRAAGEQGVPVLLAGLDAPGNYGPEYERAFEAMYPDLAERHGALLHENFLGALDAARQEGAPLSDLMQADGLHPTARGVERIVADIGPRVEALIDRIRGGDPS
jgi:acyl-CoA thioesterase-1